jgi:hypothetical protein
MISLESLQSLLTDVTSFFQFLGALLGLVAIILPLLRTLPFYHTLIYWTDVSVTLFLHALSRTSSLVSIPYSSSYSSLEELAQDPLTICLAPTCQDPSATTITTATDALVSGLSNTGNTCFLNSVLQVNFCCDENCIVWNYLTSVCTFLPWSCRPLGYIIVTYSTRIPSCS